MRFLLDSHRRNRRRLRLEELLLLALRCLAILLIALAVAGPRSTRPVLPIGAETPTDRIFILDDSASMGARHGSGSTFAAALAELTKRIEKIGPQDRLAVYRTSDGGRPWLALGRPVGPQAPPAKIEQLRLSDTRGGLGETLTAAEAALEDSKRLQQVCVISDCRGVDFLGAEADALARRLAGIAEKGAQVVWIDVGREVRHNLTIEQVRMVDRHAIAGAPIRLAVTVANHGTAPAPAVTLQVTAGQMSLPVQDVPPIPSGQSRRIDVRCVFADVGPAVVKAQLPADALAADNVASLALTVRRALDVLIVDGQLDRTDPLAGESFYLQMALDPNGDQSYGLHPEVIDHEGVGNVDFRNYDMVVLAGVPDLPAEVDQDGRLVHPTVEALKRYVQEGGGLAIFSGERMNLDFYNEVLFQGGAGLFPMRIDPPVGEARARESFVGLAVDSIAPVPMLEIFRGETSMLAGLIRVYRYTPALEEATGPVSVPGVGPPRVLARFNDERASPAIIQRRFGDGTVMVFTTTAGAKWNDWGKAVTLTYLPVMNDMVVALARRRQAPGLTDVVGRPIVLAWPDLAVGAVVTVQTPAFPEIDLARLTARASAGRGRVDYPRTRWAGVYELSYASPTGRQERMVFARNVDPAEGDLAKATQQRIASTLGPASTYVDRAGSAGGAGDPADAGAREYWRWLLVMAVGVLALEVVLAQRFGHYPPRTTEAG